MMILSWSGIRLDRSNALQQVDRNRLDSMVVQSLRSVHQAGIIHQDARPVNMLWNEELGRVMIIDFERSLIIDRVRKVLGESSANRMRTASPSKKGVTGGLELNDVDSELRFAYELSGVRNALVELA